MAVSEREFIFSKLIDQKKLEQEDHEKSMKKSKQSSSRSHRRNKR